MAIIKLIPKVSKMTDYRSNDGGYYIANCEVCGTEYYPKRSTSKYCSNTCSVIAYRNRAKAVEPKKLSNNQNSNLVATGSKGSCADFFKQFRRKSDADYLMKNMKINSSVKLEEYTIKRLSERKYVVYN